MTRFLRRGAGVVNYLFLVAMALVGCCAGAWGFLSKTEVHADKSVLATVNVADTCTMSEIIDTPHTAVVPAGTYKSDIGLSTFRAYCNDNEGFAIYAIGYTDETEGKNVLTSSTLGPTYDIAAGALTSGDSSQWAMKLAAPLDPTPTYPISVESDFSVYHAIPSEYALVAKRTANTDNGANAEGSVFTSTYQAYIFPAQPAGTYQGKVKYVLVHPSATPAPVNENQIGVIFNGNGLTFPGGATTNRVVYEESCEDEYGYIADEPAGILRTGNLDEEGNQDGSYSLGYDMGFWGSAGPFENAKGVKIEVYYKVSNGTGFNLWPNGGGNGLGWWYCEDPDGCEGTKTYIGVGGSWRNNGVSGMFDAYEETIPGYDYGFYIRVYPIYDEPTEGATYGFVRNVCSFRSVSGAYAETVPWNNYWTKLSPTSTYSSEEELISYMSYNSESLLGTNLELYSNNSITVVFNANGGSGLMENQQLYNGSRLQTNTFTMPHKDLIRWNTEPDGTGMSYSLDTAVHFYGPVADIGEGGTLTLYAQWGACAPYYYCYDDNGANSLTKMGKQYLGSSPSSTSQILRASNFQRQNYGFAGWNTEPDGTGVTYGPNETPSRGSDFINGVEGVRFYAKWVPSAGNLQNWSGCYLLDIGDVTALTDTRDGNTYAVAKLQDGNCWMIENLRLGSDTAIELTALDTENAGILPAAGATSGRDSLNIDNVSSPVSEMISADSKVYSYGNYYGWGTAINSSTDPAISSTAYTSICPVGWHLPYGGTDSGEGGGNTSGGFNYLIRLIGTYYYRRYPNNFVLSGGWRGGESFASRGSYGYYWSSTRDSNATGGYMKVFRLQVSNGSTASVSSERVDGNYNYPIRCVLNAN